MTDPTPIPEAGPQRPTVEQELGMMLMALARASRDYFEASQNLERCTEQAFELGMTVDQVEAAIYALWKLDAPTEEKL